MTHNIKYQLNDIFIKLIKQRFSTLNNQTKSMPDAAIIRRLHLYIHIIFKRHLESELDKTNDLEKRLISQIQAKVLQMELTHDDFNRNMHRTAEKYITLVNRTKMPEHYLKIILLILFPDWNCAEEDLETLNTDAIYWKTSSTDEQSSKLNSLKSRFLQLSADSVDGFINSNRTKFNNKEFVRRKSFESSFNEFAQNSESKLYIIHSNSGVGKTNVICNLALELKQKEQLVFTFESQTMEGQEKEFYSDQLIQEINEYAEASDNNAFFIFDAINETNNYDQVGSSHLTPDMQLLHDISKKLISKNYSKIKVVFTCRSEHYRLHAKQIDNIFRSLSDNQKNYFILQHYDKQELLTLYSIYEKKFKLQTTSTEFASSKYNRIHRTINNPLHFFFIAKVYQRKRIPYKEHELDFVSVVRLMIQELSHPETSTMALFEFVDVCFKQGRDYIYDDDLLQSRQGDELYSLRCLFFNAKTQKEILSNAAKVLIDMNFIRHRSGFFQFEHERVKESLLEIAFLNKHVDKTDGNKLNIKAFTDILERSVSSKEELNNQIVLSNALYNHCIKYNEYSSLEALSMLTNRKAQNIVFIVLQRLLNYNASKYFDILHEMKQSTDRMVQSTALNLAIAHLTEIDEKKYIQIKSQGVTNNPLELIKYLLENATHENFSHEILERLFFSLMQQNMPIFEIVYNDLFQILLKEGGAVNLNYLVQMGLLSCCLIIDALINEKNDVDTESIIKYLKKAFKKVFNSRYEIIYPTTYFKTQLYKIVSHLPLKIRNYIITQYLKQCVYRLCTIKHGKFVNNMFEYKPFWNLPRKTAGNSWDRTKFQALIKFLDHKTPHFLQTGEMIITGYLSVDPFSYILLERILIIQGIHNLQNVLPIISQVLAIAANNPYRDYIQMSICYSLSHILRNTPTEPWGEHEEEALLLLESTVKSWTKSCYGQFYTPSSKHLKQPKKYTQYMINFYVQALYQKSGRKISEIDQLPICKELIDEAFEKNDKALLLHCIENIPPMINNLGNIDCAMILYKYIISKKISEEEFYKLNNAVLPDYIEKRSIIELLASVFNTLSSAHPHLMQDFELLTIEPLAHERNIICQDLKKEKKMITKEEHTMPSLLTNLFGNFFVWGLNSPQVLEFIIDNLSYASKAKNALDWFNHGVEEATRILFDHKL